MPARLSCASSSLKPSGSIKCKTDFVAAHNRATLPVFGGISGSSKTMFICFLPQRHRVAENLFSFSLWVSVPLRLIKNFPKHKAMCGRSHARHTPVFARQNIRHMRQRNFPLPDLHQSSHDAPAHLVKKSVALNDKCDLRAGFFDVTAHHRADIRFHFITARGGEGFEIVLA